MAAIRTVHAGLGPIGIRIAQAAVDSGLVEVMGAADIAPELVGRAVGEVIGRSCGTATVSGGLAEALAGCDAQVLVLSTGSKMPDITDQVLAAVEAGVNVVSTAEELTWPWLRHPDLADRVAQAAAANGVTVVGTGINPGFLLDVLPLFLCRPCQAVNRVTAKRVVNVSLRRPQLQKKIGSAMDPAEYRALAAQGKLGHVGLGESAALLAAGLGWSYEKMTETIEPVIAEAATGTEHFPIQPGQVMGSHQTCTVDAGDGHGIELICRMTHGEPDPRDEVIVDGDPPVTLRIDGGIFGDSATAGCVVNILRGVVEARPGLLTVKDLPVR
jgi:4-hydroxy-tetrahydrodipicolinate reductase